MIAIAGRRYIKSQKLNVCPASIVLGKTIRIEGYELMVE
jgi:hypothetical protein